MLGEKWLAAVFYLWPSGEAPTVPALLRGAEFDTKEKDIANAPDPKRMFTGVWGGLDCVAKVEQHDIHLVLVIYFWQNDFVELNLRNKREGRVALEEDSRLGIAMAFRDACESLQPEAAFIVTHLHQAEAEFLAKYEELVITGASTPLYGECLGLLYLDDNLSRFIKPPPTFEGRDRLPVSHGLLVFAGQGNKRWV